MLEYRAVWIGQIEFHKLSRLGVEEVPELTNLMNEMSRDRWHVTTVAESTGTTSRGLFVIFERD